MQGKLIVVSYRLPYRFSIVNNLLKVTPSAGGLATALLSYFKGKQTAGSPFQSFHWLGVSDLSKRSFEAISDYRALQSDGVNLHPLFLPNDLKDNFYNGFCNSVLWPLFHYFPSYVVYQQAYHDAYEQANELVCNKVCELYEPGDTIWIQDYHFLMLPGLIRQRLPQAKIGFFLHIPFPSFEIFRVLPKPWRNTITRGLLGADLIGLHIPDYVHHVRKCIHKTLGIIEEAGGVFVDNGRTVKIDAFPISIDYDRFHELAASTPVKNEVKKIRERFGLSCKVMLSVDRLDYTKAIISRLESYEIFLKEYPQYRERIVYILLMVPTRDGVPKYRENKKETEVLISRINGTYGTLNWTPVIYQYRTLDVRKLTALYAASDVALIVPVRDGMNLVAKEYVATRVHNDGVLILSETAGSAYELHQSLLVNPNDRQEIAATIAQAMELPIEEQQRHMAAMKQTVKANNISKWVSDYMHALTTKHEPA